MTSRRTFIAATAGALAAGPLLSLAAGANDPIQPAARPLSILVLGGTGFLGPHQIEYALARGHHVTMFNRGSTSGMYGNAVEELIGNRDAHIDGGLSALEGDRRWDVVIDNSGYVPRHVRDSAELLKDRCRRYIFISTVAVYDFEAAEVFPESAKLAEWPDPEDEEVTAASYGPLKAACDRVAREILGDRCTVVRPTYVVGPGDHTDRFTYWVDRIDRGGDVLAPSGPELPAQWVDARDLCPWVITLGENDTKGVFNAAGPTTAFTRTGLMWGLTAMTSNEVRLHWPSDDLLEELDLDLPMMARSDPAYFENEASIAAGLAYRSLADTAKGTLAWWRGLPPERHVNARRWPRPEQEKTAIQRILVAS